MRPLYLLLPILTWVPIGFAQGTGLSAAIQQLPKCAQTCLSTAIKDSPCQTTNTTCVCTNAKLQGDVEGCVLQSCTLRQSLTTKNLTATLCHAPVRSKENDIRISNIVLGVISAACVMSRIIYKAVYSLGELGWDDYSVLAVLFAGLPSTIIIDRGIVPNGLGMDIWAVPFDHITNFVRYLYVLEVLYFLQIALLKLTLLFFFLRIFPKPVIRQLLWATVAFNVLWGLAFVVTSIFQCQPISYYWTSWDKEGHGKCVNINALAWSNAIISIVLDVWMLALPLFEVLQLQLSWRKKVSVAMMFFVGTFVTVVSGLRLQSLVHFAASNNPTWDQTDVINWSGIEINVGIICSCMPALRVILVRLFPKILGSTQGTSQPMYNKYGSRSQGMGGASAVRSGIGKKQSSIPDPHAITYTKSFAVQHGESDETSLVHLDEFGPKTSKVRSSNTSEVSL
ncbi:hypothetical protein CC86DRAFT_282469 [Ophiobolus disseminans]|uniref:CFEM domain-containing protein n=1 Tax=Ophiobolus disseminans TaxID=1469910 RepID=A0A6A7AEK1_9PLEO|nr:hypothetical protein CC86DRAFT_282469 [Ophiobolus disseminans]